jgi:hypothetical protein
MCILLSGFGMEVGTASAHVTPLSYDTLFHSTPTLVRNSMSTAPSERSTSVFSMSHVRWF